MIWHLTNNTKLSGVVGSGFRCMITISSYPVIIEVHKITSGWANLNKHGVARAIIPHVKYSSINRASTTVSRSVFSFFFTNTWTVFPNANAYNPLHLQNYRNSDIIQFPLCNFMRYYTILPCQRDIKSVPINFRENCQKYS